MIEIQQSGSTKLKELVAKMTLENSYWGYLFSRIRRVPKKNFGSIMGVGSTGNGMINLYFEPDLVNETSNESLMFILEHEGMHILNRHISRSIRLIGNESNDFNKMSKSHIWNIAADCCVNSQIKDFPKILKIAGKDWPALFPENQKLPKGKSSEWYYHNLLKNAKKIKISMCPQCKQGDNEEQGDGKGRPECEQCQAQNGKGDGSGGYMICDHSKWGEGNKDNLDENTLARNIDNFTRDIVKKALNNYRIIINMYPNSFWGNFARSKTDRLK